MSFLKICPILLFLGGSFLYPQQKQDVIKLKGTTVLVGKITSIDEKSVTLALKEGGSVIIQFDDIDPFCAYKIKASRAKTVDDHIRLAEWALKNGLYSAALEEYNTALDIDPGLSKTLLEKIKKVEKAEASSLLKEGELLFKQGDLEGAVRRFSRLVEKYPASEEALHAEKELKKLEGLIRDRTQRRLEELRKTREKLLEERLKKRKEEAVRYLQKALKSIQEARKLNTEGLLWDARENFIKARDAFLQAKERLFSAKYDFEKIQVLIKDIELPELAEKLKKGSKEAEKWLVITYLNLANLYASAMKLKKAKSCVNKALAINPTNEAALQLRTHITAAILQIQLTVGKTK
jgi:tetratricopeptide (TPR) repeat protein